MCTDRHLNRQGYEREGMGRLLPVGRMCARVCVLTDTLTDKAMKGGHVTLATCRSYVCACVY